MQSTLNNVSRFAPITASSGESSPTIKVWLVDDNQPLRNALKDLLNRFEGVECVADFPSPNAVLSALASKSGPDVILLDIQMGPASGLDAIRPIKALSRSTQVLMFTSCFDSEAKRRALTSGATGFLLKQSAIEKIVSSIQDATRNPAPHLKASPKKNWVAPRLSPANLDRPQQKPLLWLKNCIDRLALNRNPAAQ